MSSALTLTLAAAEGPVLARLVVAGERQSAAQLGTTWRDDKPLLELYDPNGDGPDSWGHYIDYLVVDLSPVLDQVRVVPAHRLSGGDWRLGQLTADRHVLPADEVARLEEWVLRCLRPSGGRRGRRSALAT